jgi:hypothetical protein
MPLTYQKYFKEGGLQPVFAGEEKFQKIALKVSSTFVQGTVMGELTTANDVQTISVTASGGTFTITVTIPGNAAVTTAAINYNVLTATLATDLINLVAGLYLPSTSGVGTNQGIYGENPIGSSPVPFTVTGTPGSSYVITAVNPLAKMFLPLFTLNTTLLTGGSATIAHTTPGISANTFNAYASGNSDGSQWPKCILQFDCVTDVNGNITEGDQSGGGDLGQTSITTPAFVEGTFNCADLTGLDTTAVAGTTNIPPLGRLLEGSATAGTFRMP